MGDAGWYGTESYEQAIRLAENGWPEGLARMESVRGNLSEANNLTAEVLGAIPSESGDEVDVSRYLAGEQDCMMEFTPQFVPATGRVVNVMVNCFASAGVSSDSMFWRGAAATMLIDKIESTGLRAHVETGFFCAHRNTEDQSEVRVTLKSPDQPLELDRMAFMLASSAMLRRFMFRMMEFEPPEVFARHFHYGGRPRDLDVRPEGMIYFGQLSLAELKSAEACVQFVNRTAAQYTEQQTVSA